MLRVGRRAIVSFPNFGHWSVRVAMLFTGQAPKTELFPYDWYNSPNIHFLSINDFEDLCREQDFPIERRYFSCGRAAGEGMFRICWRRRLCFCWGEGTRLPPRVPAKIVLRRA